MSCGDSHAVDCGEVIRQVYLYLDGEIDDEARAEVRDHLDECGPCLRQFGIEQEVKALVARCCGSDAAPDGLKDRLRVKLQEVRIEISSVEFRAE
ncbi:MAG: mycothiol system anti-sigma-R factor [Frankiaceae bacterium]|nr:mycothiol system anti-sigma-R factor [Frankiaceae bacterium]MBV9872737.1 mycothiol system anti-sigma-R factor [Frankiaceae bacterium]